MTTQVSFGASLSHFDPMETSAEGRTGRLAGAHFSDIAVSTSLTAQEIRASTDGENRSHAQMSFSRRS
jgi:hypothetical protein